MDTPVCNALGLNAQALGEQAARLAAISMQLGHVDPRESLDYIHPDTREGQFLKDLLEASNDEIKAKHGVSAEVLLAIK